MVQAANQELIGRTLGDFEILECIGTGGMGIVYKAHQRGMERPVALKVLPMHLAENPVLLQRFYQEARSAARLDHPGIVRAITASEQDGLHYLAMEYVDGETLAKRLRRAGPLAEPEAVRVVAAVAEALEVAHARGIIHRDIKPENVLITKDGRVKLADLGLVKRLDQDLNLTQAGKGLGTTNYMAPEQFKDAKHADARCDIYAMGVMLHTALTGKLPWPGLAPLEMYQRKRAGDLTPVRQLRPDASDRVAAVIERATQVDPQSRYATAAEFLAGLEGRRSSAAEPPLAEPLPETTTRDEIDLRAQPSVSVPASGPAAEAPSDGWFVKFIDADGQIKLLKLREDDIRHGLKSGRLARQLRIARSEHGPWLLPNAYKEFVDLVAQIKRGADAIEMQSDIERTVASLRAGAPLRRRQFDWRPLVWVGVVLAAGVIALALWLANR